MFTPNGRLQVKTPHGWCDFDGIKVTKRQGTYVLNTTDGKELRATPEHKLKLHDSAWKCMSELSVSDILHDGLIVSTCRFEDVEIDAYDLINVDGGHEYYTNGVVSSNCAFIRDFETIWTGLAPTISTGGRAILLSSPCGVGGQYYRLWTQAEAGQNDFHPIRLTWDVHPEHDQVWFDKETRSLSRRKIAQEYLCSFTTSGDTFLQPNDLEELRAQIMAPIEKTGHDRNIWVWSPPVPGHTYVISADISRGDARDYSAFHVIDVEDCEVAAEYMGKVPPEKLAEMMLEWGKKYNTALLVPESNTFGWFTNKRLKDLGYKKLYHPNNTGDPFNYIPIDPDEKTGFDTNMKTRVQILTKLEELIRTKTLKSYSQRLYDQLQAFIWHNNKPMASKDSFDDLIMSLAIGCWLVEGGSGLSEQAVTLARAMLDATRMHGKNMDQMPGGINEAQPLVNPSIRGMNAQSVYRPRDASKVAMGNPLLKDVSDFSWLMK